MKNTIKTAFAIVFCLMLGVVANAQTINGGTVALNVTTAPSFDLRSGGAPTTSGSAGSDVIVTGGVTSEQALSATLTVADASPNSSNAAITASVPIRLRSNANYKLNATRSTADSASATDLDSSDVAFSISFDNRCTGCLVEAGSDTPVAAVAAVSDIGVGATQIASGGRISTNGNTATTNNFVGANLNFSVPRQFYTPGTYSKVITVSILAL